MSDGNCEHCNTRADRDRYSDLLDISQGVVRELRAMNAAQHKEHCDTLIELQRINNADLLAAKMGFENQVLHTSEIAAENVRLRAALADAQRDARLGGRLYVWDYENPEDGSWDNVEEYLHDTTPNVGEIVRLNLALPLADVVVEMLEVGKSGEPIRWEVRDVKTNAILATKEGKKDE